MLFLLIEFLIAAERVDGLGSCWGRFVHVSKCCRSFIVSNWFIDIFLSLHNSAVSRLISFFIWELQHSTIARDIKSKLMNAKLKNWRLLPFLCDVKLGSVYDTFLWLEKDNNNRGNYLQRERGKNSFFSLTLRTIFSFWLIAIYALVEASRTFWNENISRRSTLVTSCPR